MKNTETYNDCSDDVPLLAIVAPGTLNNNKYGFENGGWSAIENSGRIQCIVCNVSRGLILLSFQHDQTCLKKEVTNDSTDKANERADEIPRQPSVVPIFPHTSVEIDASQAVCDTAYSTT
jgi:hypothetical protein